MDLSLEKQLTLIKMYADFDKMSKEQLLVAAKELFKQHLLYKQQITQLLKEDLRKTAFSVNPETVQALDDINQKF